MSFGENLKDIENTSINSVASCLPIVGEGGTQQQKQQHQQKPDQLLTIKKQHHHQLHLQQQQHYVVLCPYCTEECVFIRKQSFDNGHDPVLHFRCSSCGKVCNLSESTVANETLPPATCPLVSSQPAIDANDRSPQLSTASSVMEFVALISDGKNEKPTASADKLIEFDDIDNPSPLLCDPNSSNSITTKRKDRHDNCSTEENSIDGIAFDQLYDLPPTPEFASVQQASRSTRIPSSPSTKYRFVGREEFFFPSSATTTTATTATTATTTASHLQPHSFAESQCRSTASIPAFPKQIATSLSLQCTPLPLTNNESLLTTQSHDIIPSKKPKKQYSSKRKYRRNHHRMHRRSNVSSLSSIVYADHCTENENGDESNDIDNDNTYSNGNGNGIMHNPKPDYREVPFEHDNELSEDTLMLASSIRSNNLVTLDLARFPEDILSTEDYSKVKRFLASLSDEDILAFKRARRRYKGRNYSSKSRKSKLKLQEELDDANDVIASLEDDLHALSLENEDLSTRVHLLVNLLRDYNIDIPLNILHDDDEDDDDEGDASSLKLCN
eukprot:m.79578 g.79578  ORF g.79578 m.79578 type:complete len:556 (+) comp8610_c0_seq1:105-1772(+)